MNPTTHARPGSVTDADTGGVMRSTLLVLAYTLVYAVACGLIASLVVNPRVPSSYMDELFHVSQSVTYCQGRFDEWNDKITTLPGLYLTAIGYVKAITIGQQAWQTVGGASLHSNATGELFSLESGCTVPILRSLNILYGTLCIPLFALILRKLHPTFFSSRPLSLLVATVQLSLFPLFFFFHFLFYTDGASLFWTIATYLAHLSQWRLSSAALGLVAIMMRQTNVVWVGFMLLTDVMDRWTQNDPQIFGEKRNAPTLGGGEKEDKLSSTRELYHPSSWSDVPRTLVQLVLSCLRALPSLLRHFAWLLLLCVAFVAFFVLNGNSIVVGDRSNHTMSMHFTQVLYFMLFAVGCTAPNWASVHMIQEVARSAWRNKTLSSALVVAFGCAVHYFTSVDANQARARTYSLAHPFLLADNRHYTFYLWKNLFARWFAFRYLLLPVYLLSGGVMQRCWSSSASQTKLFQFAYWLVVCMCLAPTPLIEFRYFTTPIVVWILHAAPTLVQSTTRAAITILAYAAVNAATLTVFVYRPFTWPDGSEARFMW